MKHMLRKAATAFMIVSGSTLVSCSVDNAYDLSKDIDMTVAVGDGISIPLGSTDAIMLTEMIDPAESDVISVSDDGFYVIEKHGTFDAVDFDIEKVEDLHIDAYIDEQCYNMDLKELYNSYDEAMEAIRNNPLLPEELKQKFIDELNAHKVAVSLDEHIDKNSVEFDFIRDGLPKELNKLYRVEFDEPVRMHLQVDVKCETDKALFELLDSLELSTVGLGEEFFYVKAPEYIEFVDNEDVDGNKLYLKGAVRANANRDLFTMSWDFYINALDFKDGYDIVDGSLSLVDKLEINGAVKSNIVMVEAGDIASGCRTFEDVVFAPSITIDNFDIKTVEATVNVDIDDIEEDVDLDLGDDLEFLYEEGTVLDFANPQLVVNVNNGADVSVVSDVVMRGYDENGNAIEGAEATAVFEIHPSSSNRFFITNRGDAKEGCVSVVSDLSSLFRKLPHTIGFEMRSKNQVDELVHIDLGNSMSVSGDYEVNIPLEFNEVALTYTETIEDVLGDDPSEVTDYVKNVELVTMDFEVLNTVPAGFVPVVVAKDSNGKVLHDITVSVEGGIAAGNGMDGNEVAAPVKSSFKVLFSAKNNELANLNTIDLKLSGRGSGALNTNEYIKIEKMSVTIAKPLEIDLN